MGKMTLWAKWHYGQNESPFDSYVIFSLHTISFGLWCTISLALISPIMSWHDGQNDTMSNKKIKNESPCGDNESQRKKREKIRALFPFGSHFPHNVLTLWAKWEPKGLSFFSFFLFFFWPLFFPTMSWHYGRNDIFFPLALISPIMSWHHEQNESQRGSHFFSLFPLALIFP